MRVLRLKGILDDFEIDIKECSVCGKRKLITESGGESIGYCIFCNDDHCDTCRFNLHFCMVCRKLCPKIERKVCLNCQNVVECDRCKRIGNVKMFVISNYRIFCIWCNWEIGFCRYKVQCDICGFGNENPKMFKFIDNRIYCVNCLKQQNQSENEKVQVISILQ